MRSFAIRNLKIFFRDKSAVFFSLLSVFIIIGLYALFLGDVWVNNFAAIKGIRFLMDSWIMAGLLAVTSVTATMGAFGIMVEDRVKKITKDFYSSPLKRSSFARGYILSSFAVGVIMSVIALIPIEIYIVAGGGELLDLLSVIKVFALILISSLANTSMIFFLASFFKSQNAFATSCTIIGTMIGFMTGIYLPIGTLPETVQFVVKVFPPSHAALLLRQIIMAAPLKAAFSGAPAETVAGFKEMMGVTYEIGGFTVTPIISIAFLLLTAVLFFGLSLINLSRKNK